MRYPYYLCCQKGCVSYGKSIKRSDMEGGFVTLLNKLKPSLPLLKIAQTMLGKIWEDRGANSQKLAQSFKEQGAEIDLEIKKLVGKIIEVESLSVISAIEARIAELELQRANLNEKSQQTVHTPNSFEETFRTALAFLADPYKTWATDDFNLQGMTLRLCFSDHLVYDRFEGLRTAAITQSFRLLSQLSTPDYGLVQKS